ncbi:MAG: FKBP-type peptidyl-prolyl cis-trans isomerase [Desulfobacteraceae bacterium]|nr:FKBP-type peptidyl-prolyl cis-trans isomerase [Desulfobacteraceae bacterium]
MRTKLLLSAAGMMLLAAQVQAGDQQPFKTPKEKTSYAVGVDLVRNFRQEGIDVDLAAVIRGMQEESAGKKLQLSEPEILGTLKTYQIELRNKKELLRQQAAEKNKKEGAAFLAANKSREGVVTLPSGLQYKVIKAGNGKKPGENDAVTCHYRGTLLDGTEFDNSESMVGYPVTFFVRDSTIEGWKEALKLMPAGSKWQIFVPSELGFGEKGAGREVGPNATVIYEIELLAVNPQPVLHNKKDQHDENRN